MSESEKIKVILADDHNLFRKMLFHLLSDEDDIEVIGEASTGKEALEQCKEKNPDILILDINMPVMDGLEAIRLLHAQNNNIKVIILTAIEDDDYIFKFIREGATAYLLKDTTPQEMLKTIRAAYSGESLIQAKVMKKILNEFCKLSEQKEKNIHPTTDSKALESLTEREKEVLSLIAKGMNNKEIASSLVISEATVKTHVANLMSKLEKRDRVELVLYALKSGFSILN